MLSFLAWNIADMSTGVFIADNVAGFNFLTLSAPPIPAYKACHDCQSCATRESYCYLTDDWDDVEAVQGWHHAQEDLHTDNSA
jgi:hypothetical protein